MRTIAPPPGGWTRHCLPEGVRIVPAWRAFAPSYPGDERLVWTCPKCGTPADLGELVTYLAFGLPMDLDCPTCAERERVSTVARLAACRCFDSDVVAAYSVLEGQMLTQERTGDGAHEPADDGAADQREAAEVACLKSLYPTQDLNPNILMPPANGDQGTQP